MKLARRAGLALGVLCILVGAYAVANLVWFFTDRAGCTKFFASGCNGMLKTQDRLGFSDLGIGLAAGAVALFAFAVAIGTIRSTLKE